MIMKKNIFKLLIFSIAALIISSCELDYLPESEIGEDDYYKNTNEVLTGLVACYNGMMNVTKEEWRFTELRSDNAHLESTSSGDANNEELRRLDHMTTTSQDKFIYDFCWVPAYKVIARCNTVLAKINNVPDLDTRAKIKSELLFIRSMMYFNLTRLFGEVWLVTEPITGEEALEMTKSSVDVIYAKIIEDLEIAASAAGKLPYPTFTSVSGATKQPASETGRATIYSAKALLAKVYLTRKNYTAAKANLQPIVTDYGTSGLVAFNLIFATSNEMNKEIIFAVRFKAGGLGIGAPFVNYFAARNSSSSIVVGNGSGYNAPTDGITEKFGNTTVWSYTSGGSPIEPLSATRNLTDKRNAVSVAFYNNDVWWTAKFWESPTTVLVLNDADTDWPVIRYADVLLMYAEVLNDGADNDQTSARTYVNAVRTRAGLANLDVAATNTKTTMHAAILEERRLELAFENHRYYDMLREGNAYVVSTLNAQFANENFYKSYTQGRGPQPVTEANILLPIPLNMNKLY
ncbi:MAG: hypothetical protein ACD_77C00075G0005 [uncultured bacterium]|nr:MAG: hypothetical protein ACD_77C00075G0005 [uncultured bacterium]HBY02646.1 hypothetical protein [Rikenellaceae bacterium]